MKKFKYFILLVLVLPVCFMFAGCSKVVVSDISKTGTNGETDIYTVYYSDGTTSNFNVDNGKDGKDLGVEELFQQCVEQGLYTQDEFEKFLTDYIANHVSKNLNLYTAFNSVVSVYSAFGSNYGAGSGVIYSMGAVNSYIVTNCHVVSNYDSKSNLKLSSDIRIWQFGATDFVKFSDRSTFANFQNGTAVKCVGYSAEYDLAVLKVPTAKLKEFNSNACAVNIADGYSVAEEVYAIGNPEAEGISVTSGIVSVVSEYIEVGDNNSSVVLNVRCMRIDNAVYSGNSGGGLFNSNGELVGIVNASAADSDNYNFAIPIDNVEQVAAALIENGSESAPYSLTHHTLDDLGATVEERFESFSTLTGQLKYKVIVSGLRNGLLYNSGLKLNDEITTVVLDGQEYEITREFQINDILIGVKPNSTITFNVQRGGVSASVTLTGQQIASI